MQCPRCHGPITAPPDPGGHMICPGCGARLLSRAAKPKAIDPEAPNPGGTGPLTGSFADMESHPPEETLPPPRPRRPGEDTKPSIGQPPAPAAPPDPAPEAGPAPPPPGALEEILAELRSLRAMQQDILALLRARPGEPEPEPGVSGTTSAFEGFHEASQAPAVRTRRRKTVLLIDDDPETGKAAMAALEQAEVPSRWAPDGNAGLEAIAEEKPDVIVLELALIGDMAGKDVINMIKATMEWVDIPILLYTRAAVESQKEARTIHGADEVVPKGSGPQALVARIISLFRSR